MFSWFRRKSSETSSEVLHTFGEIKADLHSHLVPGIDDGAETISESLELIRGLIDVGYTRIITTPHINSPHFANTPEIILEGLEIVRNAVAESQLPVTIEAAAEYFINEHFLRALQQQDPFLTFGPANYILIETHQVQPPFGLDAVISDLRSLGYNPVLAHPERYAWGWGKPQQFAEWRELGLLLQLNLGSFSGVYGPQVQKAAEQLVRMNLCHFLGSDTHHMRHIERLKVAVRHPAVQELIASRNLLNLTL